MLRSLAPAIGKGVLLDFLRPPTFGQLGGTLLEAEAMGEPYHVVHIDCSGVFSDVELDGTPDEVALFEHEPQFSQVLRGPHGYLAFQDATLEQNFHLLDGVSLAELLADARVPLLTLCATPASSDQFHLEPRDFDEVAGSTQQALLSVAYDASAQGLPGALCLPYGLDPICAAEMTGKIYNELAQGRSLGEALSRVRRQSRDITDRQVTYGPIPFQEVSLPVAYEREPAPVLAARTKAPGPVPPRVVEAAAAPENQSAARPAAPVGGFIRRDAVLMQLDHAFDAFSIVLLEGDPGQGKTTLAAEFADWFSRTGGNDGPVMYTSFDHRVTLASVLDQLARIFHAGLEEAGHDWNRVEPEERQEVILQVMNQIPCFWIWDNVEAVEPVTDESEWSDVEREELTRFLRSARQSQAKFLLVSSPAEHRWLGIMPRRVSISGLPPCERLQMTRALVEHDDGRLEDADDWRPLLDYSEGNPLALACLTACAVKEEIESAGGLRALQGRVASAASGDDGGNVARAALSYAVNKGLGENDRRVLALLHLFRGTVNVERLAAQAEGPADAALPHLKKNRAFVELSDDPESSVLDRAAKLHLLTRRGRGVFTMHPMLPPLPAPLFQAAVQSESDPRGKKRSFFDTLRSRVKQADLDGLTVANRAYVRSFSDFGARSFARLKTGDPDVEAELAGEKANLSHALSLARRNEWFDLIGGCVQGLGALFEAQGQVSAWEGFVGEHMKECAERGTEKPLSGRGLYWRAVVEQGVYAAARLRHLPRAEQLQRLCLHWDREEAAPFITTASEQWDEDARQVVRRWAESLYRLSSIMRKQGFPEPKVDQEAVDLVQQLGETETASQWTFELGLAYTDEPGVRNLDQADRWFQQSLALRDEDDRLGRAGCYSELGRVSWELFGMARKANMAQTDLMRHLSDTRQHYIRAIENDPPDDWVKLAHHNQELGHICFALGDLGRALPYYREAIRYYERQGDVSEAANTRFTLAVSLRDDGRLAEARRFAADAHAGFQKIGADPEMIQRTRRILDSIEERLETQTQQRQADQND